VLLIIPNVYGSTYLLKAGLATYMLTIFVRNGMLLTVVYINFLVLIPKFFNTKRYLEYLICVAVLIAAVVGVNTQLDRYNYKQLGFPVMTGREALQEMLFYVFTICSYILTSFLLFSLQEKRQQKERLDQVELEKLGTEIKYLRAQINPHFLFNTLNNLYGLALERSEKTPEIILKLSQIMDYMLYESNDLKVYLKKDINNVQNYIDIERIRQGNNAEILFDVKGEITNQVIVPLILLPLVENAFKHGVNTIIKGAYMHVNITVNESSLEIDVKNNFKRPNEEEHHDGIGLSNLQQRLDLFYPEDHTMKVDSVDENYHVNLKLSLS
jgi:sensor histidine kinase YesM